MPPCTTSSASPTSASPDKLLGYFRHIDASGHILLAGFNDLLDLAKQESGKMVFDFQPTDLNPLLAAIADEFHPLLSERQLRVECHTSPERAEIRLDPPKILQVLRNLVGNAINFSPPHGLIKLAVAQRAQSVVVTVSDQGVGIPAGEEGAIFDKFIQSSKTKTGAGGTGVGLSICREIIVAHHRRATDRPPPASLHQEAA